jgi:hypothetical protein
MSSALSSYLNQRFVVSILTYSLPLFITVLVFRLQPAFFRRGEYEFNRGWQLLVNSIFLNIKSTSFLAMAMSSVSVVTSSLFLRNFRKPIVTDYTGAEFKRFKSRMNDTETVVRKNEPPSSLNKSRIFASIDDDDDAETRLFAKV